MERLAFLGPVRLAVIALPNRKSLRIEAHNLTAREAKALVAQFGGTVREAADRPTPPPPPRKPLAIRDQLIVTDRPLSAAAGPASGFPAGRPVLVIPAAMAFGTGDHVTTASCLRLLCDAARERAGKPWEFLDLGTGSGILAIAAKKLGARRVEACDFDPHAVRTARENVALNAAAPLPVRKTDVLQWTPARTWEVVAANLFAEVLVAAAPAIAPAVAAGGRLILSGILREKEAEVLEAFGPRGFAFERAVRKGKWVTLFAAKVAAAAPGKPTQRRSRQKTR